MKDSSHLTIEQFLKNLFGDRLIKYEEYKTGEQTFVEVSEIYEEDLEKLEKLKYYNKQFIQIWSPTTVIVMRGSKVDVSVRIITNFKIPYAVQQWFEDIKWYGAVILEEYYDKGCDIFIERNYIYKDKNYITIYCKFCDCHNLLEKYRIARNLLEKVHKKVLKDISRALKIPIVRIGIIAEEIWGDYCIIHYKSMHELEIRFPTFLGIYDYSDLEKRLEKIREFHQRVLKELEKIKDLIREPGCYIDVFILGEAPYNDTQSVHVKICLGYSICKPGSEKSHKYITFAEMVDVQVIKKEIVKQENEHIVELMKPIGPILGWYRRNKFEDVVKIVRSYLDSLSKGKL